MVRRKACPEGVMTTGSLWEVKEQQQSHSNRGPDGAGPSPCLAKASATADVSKDLTELTAVEWSRWVPEVGRWSAHANGRGLRAILQS